MHSQVLLYIMNFIIGFFNYQFPWDNGTWTIKSYIIFCFITFCVAFIVWYILLIPLNKLREFGD